MRDEVNGGILAHPKILECPPMREVFVVGGLSYLPSNGECSACAGYAGYAVTSNTRQLRRTSPSVSSPRCAQNSSSAVQTNGRRTVIMYISNWTSVRRARATHVVAYAAQLRKATAVHGRVKGAADSDDRFNMHERRVTS